MEHPPASRVPQRARSRATLEDLAALYERVEHVLVQSRKDSYDHPDKPKHPARLRSFTMSDVCDLLDLHPTTFYEIVRGVPNLAPKKDDEKNQWQFTLEEIHKIQAHRGTLPRQLYEIDRAVMIAIANFKGGVAKTLTATLLAQYLALRGYRVLCIDSDPQATKSGNFGFPIGTVDDWHTMLPWLYGRKMVEDEGQEFPSSLREAIKSTYWPGLDLLAANLSLYSGEFVLGLRRHTEQGFQFHLPIAEALEDVRGDYDVIITDMPPALSLSTAAGIFAADGLIIPAPPEMPDLESAAAFLKLTIEVLTAVRNNFGDNKEFEIFKVLVTKYEGTSAHKDLARKILTCFQGFCVREPMVKTAAVSNLAKKFLTLYEQDPRAPGRAVLKRALESANDVNLDIEADIVDLLRERLAAKRAATSNKEDAAA